MTLTTIDFSYDSLNIITTNINKFYDKISKIFSIIIINTNNLDLDDLALILDLQETARLIIGNMTKYIANWRSFFNITVNESIYSANFNSKIDLFVEQTNKLVDEINSFEANIIKVETGLKNNILKKRISEILKGENIDLTQNSKNLIITLLLTIIKGIITFLFKNKITEINKEIIDTVIEKVKIELNKSTINIKVNEILYKILSDANELQVYINYIDSITSKLLNIKNM